LANLFYNPVMPYSPSSEKAVIRKEPVDELTVWSWSTPPRVTPNTGLTKYPKMGFQMNGVENVATPVASNNGLIPNSIRNVRTHGEYIEVDGLIFFVNTKGQIGVVDVKSSDAGMDSRILLLEKCRNYFSWGGSVPCNGRIQTEYLYQLSELAAFESESSHETYIRKCVYDDDPYKNYKPYGQAQCSGGSLQRPVFRNYIGFQTSENTCIIFKKTYRTSGGSGLGHVGERTIVVKYRGEYDGRRFPVEFNWRDWAFDSDPKIPNMNGGGVTRGEAFIPELDEHGLIKWAMPKQSAIVVTEYDVDGNEITDVNKGGNPNRLPSPIPQLHKIPTWLIWRHWFYPHPMSIVKHGLAKFPYVHPGYVAKNYILIRSYILKPCSSTDMCSGKCVDTPHENKYFFGLDDDNAGLDSNAFDVKAKAIVTESELKEITRQCIHEGTPMGSLKPKEPAPCGGGGDIKPAQPCETDRQKYVVEVLVTYYEFDPDELPHLHQQIQGFVFPTTMVHDPTLNDSQQTYEQDDSWLEVTKKQPLFFSAKESRRIGSGVLPVPFPLDWSLLDEFWYGDKDTPLSNDWYINSARDDADRLTWWQRYLPSFFVYQNKPLSAFVVSIPMQYIDGVYAKYVMWQVEYPATNGRSNQVREISETNINNFVPPWLSFSEYKRIPTVVPGVYLPQDPYTFEITLEDGSAPVIAKLNMHPPSGGGFATTPNIKPLLEICQDVYVEFLDQWTTAVLLHEYGEERYGAIALRLQSAQRSAFLTTVQQILAEHVSLNSVKNYIALEATALKQQVITVMNGVIDTVLDQTLALHMQVRAGTVDPKDYQNALNLHLFDLMADINQPLYPAVINYITTVLQHPVHGFTARYIHNVRTAARTAFLDFPSLFKPFWTDTPFTDLEIDAEIESLTFVNRFKKKFLAEADTPIISYVAAYNYQHPQNQTSKGAVIALIEQWFDDVFVPSVEWNMNEPQPHLVKHITETYLSNYEFAPEYVFEIETASSPITLSVPTVIPIVHIPDVLQYAEIVRSHIRAALTEYMHDTLTHVIKEGILQIVAGAFTDDVLATEREFMLDTDDDDETTAVQRCLVYVKTMLDDVFINAVNQLP